jgi:hypothetical protein
MIQDDPTAQHGRDPPPWLCDGLTVNLPGYCGSGKGQGERDEGLGKPARVQYVCTDVLVDATIQQSTNNPVMQQGRHRCRLSYFLGDTASRNTASARRRSLCDCFLLIDLGMPSALSVRGTSFGPLARQLYRLQFNFWRKAAAAGICWL